jgi:hypothetical protein
MRTHYAVAWNSDLDLFMQDVNTALAHGWLLQGGVFAYDDKFFQAMTKLMPEPELETQSPA